MGNSQHTDFDFSVEKKPVSTDIQEDAAESQEGTTEKQERTYGSTVSTPAQPQIPEDSAPFIVLCGPPASGKSMVLKCLATYLYSSNKGYSISANPTLLKTQKYQDECKIFNSIIGKVDVRMKNTVNYLLADVNDNRGNVVAHFLEAPGEDFFSITNAEQEPHMQFKAYMDKIAQIKPDKKRLVIYIILLDLDSATSLRNDVNLRKKYEQKMVNLYNRYVINHPSKVILLYNKVDIPKNGTWANPSGCMNPAAVLNDAKINYPKLFFKKKFLFWEMDNFSFLPFCTGSYSAGNDNYTSAGPKYPADLWNEILKLW